VDEAERANYRSLRDPRAEDVIGLDTITDVATWLIEQVVARPTGTPSASSEPLAMSPSGTPSTVGSHLREATSQG
jgi:hypothetical protein